MKDNLILYVKICMEMVRKGKKKLNREQLRTLIGTKFNIVTDEVIDRHIKDMIAYRLITPTTDGYLLGSMENYEKSRQILIEKFKIMDWFW